jgi:hypothetical protein
MHNIGGRASGPIFCQRFVDVIFEFRIVNKNYFRKGVAKHYQALL